ncbi:hypothetical protein ACFYVL_16800 [Streptomyces sp. NPDC004111]|uniref:hypothetical protein n=1 Tax=Streptomyces sp. NPDC004111 TaxID=3364690 RepID=UPI00368D76BF
MRTPTTRRRALAWSGAAAAGLLAGCSNSSGTSGSAGTQRDTAVRKAAVRLRESATRTSLDLLAHYDALLKKHPGEAERLRPLRAEVARQAKVLRGEGRAAVGRPPVTVAADPKAAVKELAAAEQRTSDAHLAALTGATPELARLLASVAAAGAGHVFLLTDGEPK